LDFEQVAPGSGIQPFNSRQFRFVSEMTWCKIKDTDPRHPGVESEIIRQFANTDGVLDRKQITPWIPFTTVSRSLNHLEYLGILSPGVGRRKYWIRREALSFVSGLNYLLAWRFEGVAPSVVLASSQPLKPKMRKWLSASEDRIKSYRPKYRNETQIALGRQPSTFSVDIGQASLLGSEIRRLRIENNVKYGTSSEMIALMQAGKLSVGFSNISKVQELLFESDETLKSFSVGVWVHDWPHAVASGSLNESVSYEAGSVARKELADKVSSRKSEPVEGLRSLLKGRLEGSHKAAVLQPGLDWAIGDVIPSRQRVLNEPCVQLIENTLLEEGDPAVSYVKKDFHQRMNLASSFRFVWEWLGETLLQDMEEIGVETQRLNEVSRLAKHLNKA
jgi:hypothetical protein